MNKLRLKSCVNEDKIVDNEEKPARDKAREPRGTRNIFDACVLAKNILKFGSLKKNKNNSYFEEEKHVLKTQMSV